MSTKHVSTLANYRRRALVVADAFPDNCPLTANPDQHDFDSDGLGDMCDGDIDDDGTPNDDDVCELTELGGVVDATNGCSIAQLCPCERMRPLVGTVLQETETRPWNR